MKWFYTTLGIVLVVIISLGWFYTTRISFFLEVSDIYDTETLTVTKSYKTLDELVHDEDVAKRYALPLFMQEEILLFVSKGISFIGVKFKFDTTVIYPFTRKYDLNFDEVEEIARSKAERLKPVIKSHQDATRLVYELGFIRINDYIKIISNYKFASPIEQSKQSILLTQLKQKRKQWYNQLKRLL